MTSSNPCWRSSTVETPGWVVFTNTEPSPPIRSTSASPATRPPSTLSVAIRETPMSGSSTIVSTRTTVIPASCAAWSGPIKAVRSVGAMRMASGCCATTASTIGICSVGSNSFGP
jgi:hypothetical protein